MHDVPLKRGIARPVVAALVVIASAGILRGLDTREAAPRFTAKSLDGEKFTNETLKGRVVLLQFWATWCKFCRSDQDAVEVISHEFADRGLVVLAVNVGESKTTVKRYLDHSPRSCKIVLGEDTNLSAMFAATDYPLYVVIDRNGKIAATQRGAAGEDSLRRLLSQAGLDSQ